MVEVKGQRYCLICLGFGLNVALLIMWSIVNAVMKQDEAVNTATSSYIDDIFVNDSMCSAICVKEHLEQFGLTGKVPEQLRHGTHVGIASLGGAKKTTMLCCGSELPTVPSVLTHCVIFSVCGKLTGHFPVCVSQPHL